MAILRYIRVEFSTRRDPGRRGELRRLQWDMKAETEKAAEAIVKIQYPDALKVLSRPVNRAERRRK